MLKILPRASDLNVFFEIALNSRVDMEFGTWSDR
jgi:hypothetical protein